MRVIRTLALGGIIVGLPVGALTGGYGIYLLATPSGTEGPRVLVGAVLIGTAVVIAVLVVAFLLAA